MKKGIPLLFIAFVMVSFSTAMYSQDLDESGLSALVDFELFEKRNTKYHTKTKSMLTAEDRIAKAKAYDLYVSKDFGSYLNPYNGNLYIINNENKKFNRAQFMNEDTSEKIFSMPIDQTTTAINIEDYAPGEYMLILSNDRGDILVESFIIF